MAIKKIHLPDGEEVVIDEWLHYQQFSTIEFAAGSQINLRAFTYVQGQVVPQQGLVPRNATESDTNQVAKTRMNHDEAYLCYAITWEAFALSSAESETFTLAPAPAMLSQNVRRLQRDVVLSLVVGANIKKPQARAPFSRYGQSVGAPAYPSSQALTAATAFSYGTGGKMSASNQRRFQLPVYIASDRVFYVEVRSFPGAITDLSQAVRLRIYLDGLKRRPVA
jgi:hypothetical protein